ncbi:YbaB/EbfC family nucleoid-associated protein [Micromonospora sp. NBC_01796]|uniref:YbaB/EbfC family nucleoid-associated protein n=1 Tax=Micromonospora sp. NBC_01796 TaxID=2975987 RepID=UPI002DD9F31D|nr:YbaB/EbfC family nucleoid-associated protein [Micromonospora sp. NBC_01796]WSA84555.1 YbaB/EbfC family nucleoid-associated protein [Micromonospora sp. NBC_01796]
MSSPLHNQIEQAYAELERSQAALAGVQEELAGAQTTVTSKNRAITVTVDSRGDLVDIKFLTRSYRTMPSAELATLLIETIAEARTKAQAAVAATFQSVLPTGMSALDMINGTVDFEEMMREAIRIANEPFPGDEPTEQPKPGGGR